MKAQESTMHGYVHPPGLRFGIINATVGNVVGEIFPASTEHTHTHTSTHTNIHFPNGLNGTAASQLGSTGLGRNPAGKHTFWGWRAPKTHTHTHNISKASQLNLSCYFSFCPPPPNMQPSSSMCVSVCLCAGFLWKPCKVLFGKSRIVQGKKNFTPASISLSPSFYLHNLSAANEKTIKQSNFRNWISF